MDAVVVVVATVDLVVLLVAATVLSTVVDATARVEILGVRTKVFVDVALVAIVDVSVVPLVDVALVVTKLTLDVFAKKKLLDVTAWDVADAVVAVVAFVLAS